MEWIYPPQDIGYFCRLHDEQTWDLIVPVPLTWNRCRKRGYNQSALLAKTIGRAIGCPVVYNSLKRRNTTKSQVGLGKKHRHQNVRNAFHISRQECFENKRILLVDDVVTTGATITECAKTLKRSRALSVDGWSVAREP